MLPSRAPATLIWVIGASASSVAAAVASLRRAGSPVISATISDDFDCDADVWMSAVRAIDR